MHVAESCESHGQAVGAVTAVRMAVTGAQITAMHARRDARFSRLLSVRECVSACARVFAGESDSKPRSW
eukprot:5767207-Pleurochrysis_carterae.AAC.3